MSREWEVPELKEFDDNDFWYGRYDWKAAEKEARRFDPSTFKEHDLRYSEARMYSEGVTRYLRDHFKRKNSCRGLI